MGLLTTLLNKLRSKSQEATITLLGPSQAGKTTLIRYLETGETVEDDPLSTLGVDYRSEPIDFDNLSVNLIDVGGQKIYQDAFWDFAVEQSNGIIYIIDSIVKPEDNEEKFNKQLRQFQYALDIVPHDTVLLILLNKQDLQEFDPITVETFKSFYPMDKLMNRTFTILPSSAKFGNGVEEAFTWFVEAMSQKL